MTRAKSLANNWVDSLSLFLGVCAYDFFAYDDLKRGVVTGLVAATLLWVVGCLLKLRSAKTPS